MALIKEFDSSNDMNFIEEFESLNGNYIELLRTGNDHLIRLADFTRKGFKIEIDTASPKNFIEIDLFNKLIEIRIEIPPGGIKDKRGELVTWINEDEVRSLTVSFDITGEISMPDISNMTVQNFPRIYFKELLSRIVDGTRTIFGKQLVKL